MEPETSADHRRDCCCCGVNNGIEDPCYTTGKLVVQFNHLAPRTFRTPTSAERREERAVERFIKLMHAISNMNKAIDVRMYK